MQSLRKLLLTVLCCLIYKVNISQIKEICILDLTVKNAEVTTGDVFSVNHILKSAGFSFSTTDSVNLAIHAKIIITTCNIEITTFQQPEKDSLIKFVARGGILISNNCKDPYFNSIFGISSSVYSSTRMLLNFNTDADPVLFKLFDDPNEKQIRFANPLKNTTTIGTRAFSLGTATALANYETGEIGIVKNKYMAGQTFLFGTQFKDVILRPQVGQASGASRYFSNNFEPAEDVYVFLISAIIKQNLPHVIYKNVAPNKYRAALTVTHDVDATTSMNLFDEYANYEKINNISSTYLITTHYMHDRLAKDFFDGFSTDIMRVYNMGRDIQSHSVSHVPDFDNPAVVSFGVAGNTKDNYRPFYTGVYSKEVTVLGEIEVSIALLNELIPTPVTVYRTGYLAFHEKLINGLDSLKVPYNSSHSAGDMMTNFPFYSHTDLRMDGRETKVLEIPNSISDVFQDEAISEENYLTKVDSWKRNFGKCYNNNMSSVLLVHPTRYYKLYAEQLFIRSLPNDVITNNLSEYGLFWTSRNAVEFTSTENADTLTIQLSVNAAEINPDVAFIVNNGSTYSKIKVYSLDNQLLPLEKSPWETNSVILHTPSERPNYNIYSISFKPLAKNTYIYPNPSGSGKQEPNVHFEIMEDSDVTIDIIDLKGNIVHETIDKSLILGPYDIQLPKELLPQNVYIVRLRINDDETMLKWVNIY